MAEGEKEALEATPERTIYELGYHMVPSIGEENVAAEVAALKAIIERHEGVFLVEEHPVLTQLSYTLRIVRSGKREKYTTAYFGSLKFEIEPRLLARVKEDLEQDQNILRHLLITTVREETRAPKRIFQKPETPAPTSAPRKETTRSGAAEKAEKGEVSEAELDRSIAELVVE